VDGDISSKFCRQIDFNFLKLIPPLNLDPEVHFRLYGRHLEKSAVDIIRTVYYILGAELMKLIFAVLYVS